MRHQHKNIMLETSDISENKLQQIMVLSSSHTCTNWSAVSAMRWLR